MSAQQALEHLLRGRVPDISDERMREALATAFQIGKLLMQCREHLVTDVKINGFGPLGRTTQDLLIEFCCERAMDQTT